jgi:dihydrofolate reductase
MRKLIMWNLVTLDGFFEGAKPWDLDWHEYVWGDQLEQISIDQLKSADTLVFGRATYQGMAAYWPTAKTEGTEVPELMNGISKVVFSNTLTSADWNNTTLIKGRAEDAIVGLKQQTGKDAFIFGSANLSSSLMKAGLIDEYRLCVVPVVLGAGTPLFKPSPNRTRLHLLETRPLRGGGVILRYANAPR